MPVTHRLHLIGRLAQFHPYVAKCDQPDCIWITSHESFAEAERWLGIHYCPWVGDMTGRVAAMAAGRSNFEKMFEYLDEAYDAMLTARAAKNDLEAATHQGRMMGMAQAVVEWMVPIFRESADVARELKKRRQARLAGEATNTPGVDYRWTPQPREGDQPKAPTKPEFTVPAGPKPVPDAVRASISKAIASGIPFADEELAKMYEVTPAQIAAIRKEVAA